MGDMRFRLEDGALLPCLTAHTALLQIWPMKKLPPDVPLSPEAERLMAQVLPRIQQGLAAVHRIPVSVLIWGPGLDSTSPLLDVRLQLRSCLRTQGHAAYFSEELCEPGIEHSLRLQQSIQAQEFELIVSIPATPGSIAEVHDVAIDRRVSAKLLVFLNEESFQGYSAQSLQAMNSILGGRITHYPNDRDTAIIEAVTLEHVQKIRELKYLGAGKYQP
jgi:hypothetical protein